MQARIIDIHETAGDRLITEPRITVAEAAKMLGCTPMFLRLAMQRGLIDVGTCQVLTGQRYTYYINRAKLEKYIRGE